MAKEIHAASGELVSLQLLCNQVAFTHALPPRTPLIGSFRNLGRSSFTLVLGV